MSPLTLEVTSLALVLYTVLIQNSFAGDVISRGHTHLEAIGGRPENMQALRSARYIHHTYPLRVSLAEQVTPKMHHLVWSTSIRVFDCGRNRKVLTGFTRASLHGVTSLSLSLSLSLQSRFSRTLCFTVHITTEPEINTSTPRRGVIPFRTHVPSKATKRRWMRRYQAPGKKVQQ